MPLDYKSLMDEPSRGGATLLFQLAKDSVGNARGKAAEQAKDSESIPGQMLALPPEERIMFLEDYVRTVIGQVLRLDRSLITSDRPLGTLGLESLSAIELRNRLESGLALTLSATVMWNHPTVATLAKYLADRMMVPLPPPGSRLKDLSDPSLVRSESEDAQRPSGSVGAAMAQIESLSDEEALEALIGRPADKPWLQAKGH
jgi:acyl carrier protein